MLHTKGHEAVVNLLLAKDGDDPDSRNKDGQTPLMMAAYNVHDRLMHLLLVKDGVDPDSRDNDSRTSLMMAAYHGHDAVVKLLFEKGADLESKDKSGWTPLSWAARSGPQGMGMKRL